MKLSSLARASVLAAMILAPGTCDLAAQAADEQPRNLVFMLGDGMGFSHLKVYRL